MLDSYDGREESVETAEEWEDESESISVTAVTMVANCSKQLFNLDGWALMVLGAIRFRTLYTHFIDLQSVS